MESGIRRGSSSVSIGRRRRFETFLLFRVFRREKFPARKGIRSRGIRSRNASTHEIDRRGRNRKTKATSSTSFEHLSHRCRRCGTRSGSAALVRREIREDDEERSVHRSKKKRDSLPTDRTCKSRRDRLDGEEGMGDVDPLETSDRTVGSDT